MGRTRRAPPHLSSDTCMQPSQTAPCIASASSSSARHLASGSRLPRQCRFVLGPRTPNTPAHKQHMTRAPLWRWRSSVWTALRHNKRPGLQEQDHVTMRMSCEGAEASHDAKRHAHDAQDLAVSCGTILRSRTRRTGVACPNSRSNSPLARISKCSVRVRTVQPIVCWRAESVPNRWVRAQGMVPMFWRRAVAEQGFPRKPFGTLEGPHAQPRGPHRASCASARSNNTPTVVVCAGCRPSPAKPPRTYRLMAQLGATSSSRAPPLDFDFPHSLRYLTHIDKSRRV